MKYWYLKGEDVLGPADVETISKDEMFSEDLFVCPEHESDNTDSWKSANQYMQDFGYILDPAHYSKPEPEPVAEPKPVAEPESVSESKPVAETKPVAEPEPEPAGLHEVTDKPQENNFPLGDTLKQNGINPVPFTETNKPSADSEQETLTQDIIDEIEKEISADNYTDNGAGNPAENIPSVQEQQIPAAVSENSPAEITFRQPDFEETIHSRSPLNAGADNNLLDEIPAKAVLSEEAPATETKQKEYNTAFAVKAVPVVKIGQQADKPQDSRQKNTNGTEAPSFDAENNESLDTFTVSAPALQIKPLQEESSDLPSSVLAAQKKETESHPGQALEMMQMPVIMPAPSLKSKPVTAKVTPEETSNDMFDFSDVHNIFGQQEEAKTHPREDTLEDLNTENYNHNEDLLPESDGGLLSVQEDLNNQFIAAGPNTTGKILSTSHGAEERQVSKRNDLMYLMVMFMSVLIIIAVVMMFATDKDRQANTRQEQEYNAAVSQQMPAKNEEQKRPVIQGIDEGVASPEVPEKTVTETAALKAETYAENLVRKHILKNGETVEQHLGKLFGTPYQARWSSNKLYGNVYVVEFFASKVRSEPIRYMFSVNIDNGAIEGMNNATIDLI